MADNKTEQQAYDEAWSEDESLPQEAAEQDVPEEESPGVAVVISAAPEGEDDAPDSQAAAVEEAAEGESPTEQAAEGGAGEAAEEMTPEEVQKQKSWEGRLKKREEELSARAAELESASAAPAAPAAPEASPENISAVEAKFAEDFGPDFIGDLKTLIQHYAGSAAGDFGKGFESKLAGLANGIQSALQSMHESAILDAHPDLDDVVASEAFQKWLESKDEDKRNTAVNVLAKGMWPQIIRLVATFKDENKAGAEQAGPAEETTEENDPFDESPIASPASVALRMPSKPGNDADEYERAWEE
ncbi:MAG: hypothetical protein IPO08_22910 [Xanthomonadales bacterium]|nr:hypothetical protein [Xanthomonadales bacterium]